MSVLSVDDILPLSAYRRVRSRSRARVADLRRARRVRLGSAAVVLFEIRDTVVFQVQEILHCEGDGPGRTQRVLDDYDAIVPRMNELRATVMLDGGDPEQGRAMAAALAGSVGVELCAGRQRCPSRIAAPSYGTDDPIWYVRWSPSRAWLDALHRAQDVRVEVDTPGTAVGRVDAAVLVDDLRQSGRGTGTCVEQAVSAAGSAFDRCAPWSGRGAAPWARP